MGFGRDRGGAGGRGACTRVGNAVATHDLGLKGAGEVGGGLSGLGLRGLGGGGGRKDDAQIAVTCAA